MVIGTDVISTSLFHPVPRGEYPQIVTLLERITFRCMRFNIKRYLCQRCLLDYSAIWMGESECFNKNLAPGSSEVFKDISFGLTETHHEKLIDEADSLIRPMTWKQHNLDSPSLSKWAGASYSHR